MDSFQITTQNYDVITNYINTIYKNKQIPLITIYDKENNETVISDNNNQLIENRIITSISIFPKENENDISKIIFVFDNKSNITIYDSDKNYWCKFSIKPNQIRTF